MYERMKNVYYFDFDSLKSIKKVGMFDLPHFYSKFGYFLLINNMA